MVLAARGLPSIWCVAGRRWSAARSPRAARTPSTATSTATSTRSCGAPGGGRCARARGVADAARWSSASCSARVAPSWLGAGHELARRGADRRRDRVLRRSSTRCCSSAAPRRTSSWGGAAGCMPVLIGWSAVTGTSPGRRRRCSPWSSSGRRRTSGRWPCATATTTRGRGADAAGGRVARAVVAADRRLLVGDGGRHARARPVRPGCTRPRRWRRRGSSPRRTGCTPEPLLGRTVSSTALFHRFNAYLRGLSRVAHRGRRGWSASWCALDAEEIRHHPTRPRTRRSRTPARSRARRAAA